MTTNDKILKLVAEKHYHLISLAKRIINEAHAELDVVRPDCMPDDEEMSVAHERYVFAVSRIRDIQSDLHNIVRDLEIAQHIGRDSNETKPA